MILNLPQRLVSMRVLFAFALFSLAFISCRDGGTSQSTTTQAPERTNVIGNENPSDENVINVNPNAGTANAGFHYVCANNCEGSGSSTGGTCPVCGEELVHNDAFHAGEQGASNSPQIMGADDEFTSRINPIGTTGNDGNAAGAVTGNAMFHYTCSAGCGGGGDSQGNCPSCGAELVHNAAFHNAGGGTASPGAVNQAAPTSTNRYPSVFNTPGAVPPANRINTSGGGGGGTGFHYICSAGCGGGAAAQGSCPSCGAALVHNDAFH